MIPEIEELIIASNSLLKSVRIEHRTEPEYCRPYAPEHPWERNSLDGEIFNWRHKFIGRSALEFKHCVLTIAIRRGDRLPERLAAYFAMWAEEPGFLVNALDVKWLVSACDTFVDHCEDEAEQATALAAAILLKTIKLYETEMRLRYERRQDDCRPNYEAIELFDGLFTFNIGYGDVVINLRDRITRIAGRGTPAALIVAELFSRVCRFDTAFRRLREEHSHDPTRW